MALRYGDVLRPFNHEAEAALPALRDAVRCFSEAIAAADYLTARADRPRLAAERELWRLSRDALEGLADYVATGAESGAGRGAATESSVKKIETALRRMHSIAGEFKGTWGSCDFERFLPAWLERLRRNRA